MTYDLSIVIPAFNEEKRIGRTVDRIQEYFSGRGRLELVIADDGSQDETVRAVRERLAPTTRLLVERSERNLGKGAAVRRGMLAASGALRLFMDADLSVPLEVFEEFLPRFDAGNDVVIGSRRMPGAELVRRQSVLRECLGTGYRALARWVIASEITDFTCGFKCFTAAATEQVFTRAVLDGWSYDAEILFIAHRLGLRIGQVPVSWTNDPDTKVRLSRDVLRSLGGLIAIRVNAMKGVYGLPQA